jgi:hypothetical protein
MECVMPSFKILALLLSLPLGLFFGTVFAIKADATTSTGPTQGTTRAGNTGEGEHEHEHSSSSPSSSSPSASQRPDGALAVPDLFPLWLFSRAPTKGLKDQKLHDEDKARNAVNSGEVRPLQQVMTMLQTRVPGDVLKVGLQQGQNDGWIYTFVVLDKSGVYKDVLVDAKTNSVLRITER